VCDTGPPDQVQEFASFAPTVDLGVEDLGDLELWLAVNFDWRGWWLGSVGDGVGHSWFEL